MDLGHAPAAGIVHAQKTISRQSSDSLEALLTNIEDSVKRLVSSHQGNRYSAVKVVLLKWADCNLDPTIENEILELQDVFRDSYGFDAGYAQDVFRIPSNWSAALQAYVSNAIYVFSQLQTSEKKLMVVYYNSHGDVDPVSRELRIGGYGLIDEGMPDSANGM